MLAARESDLTLRAFAATGASAPAIMTQDSLAVHRAFRALFERASYHLSHDPPTTELAAVFWLARMADLRLPFVASGRWTMDERSAPVERLAGESALLFMKRAGARVEMVVGFGAALALVQRGTRATLDVVVAAPTDEEAQACLQWVRSALPKTSDTGADRRVALTFWSYYLGANDHVEQIDVCRWSEIEENYPESTRRLLRREMIAGLDGRRGKLALWLGPPGTGKTCALRALAREQRAALSVHYVLDAETFLSRSDYVLHVFRGDDEHKDDDDENAVVPTEPRRERLIVLEDAGELLAADARSTVGQGLSRLLNLTDGLPGQATRTRVLITTNEDVGRLHPAVTRAGRCAAIIRFPPLDATEARSWLTGKGRPDLAASVNAPSAIADLYAMLAGEQVARAARRTAGFHVEARSSSTSAPELPAERDAK